MDNFFGVTAFMSNNVNMGPDILGFFAGTGDFSPSYIIIIIKVAVKREQNFK